MNISLTGVPLGFTKRVVISASWVGWEIKLRERGRKGQLLLVAARTAHDLCAPRAGLWLCGSEDGAADDCGGAGFFC
jgi:hypothetical protein